MSYIKFDKNLPILIYGAGEVGENCAVSLRKEGYKVIAFLDQFKEGIDIITGFEVIRLGNKSEKIQPEKSLVIICLANGNIHKKVADKLFMLGYQYIAFLPLNFALSDKIKNGLTNNYNNILGKRYNIIRPIESYDNYYYPQIKMASAIIRRDGEYIVAWLGLEALYTETLELWTGDKGKVYGEEKFHNINISLYHAYKQLFGYFSGKSDNYIKYVEGSKLLVKKDEYELKQIVEERYKLFLEFKKNINRGMEFFINSAPYVVFNQDHFNLVGGHHRTIFLLNEGHTLFPVKMSKKDYKIWCNNYGFYKLRRFIYKEGIRELFAPIPHPAFIDFPSLRDNYGDTLFEAVLTFLQEKSCKGMTALDISDSNGYFSRIGIRGGLINIICMQNNMQQVELVRLINELLYLHDITVCVVNEEFIGGRYDIGFAINVIEKVNGTELFRILDSCIEKYLFWEFNEDNLQYKGIFINDYHFTEYKCLYKENLGTNILELGVFIKR